MVEAYPLAWPSGWKRTQWPETSRFDKHPMGYAMAFLMDELKKLGASHVIVSTNLTRRKTDGLPYAKQRTPEDRGVAVYFQWEGQSQCMPCDKWERIECNIWAIAKSIEALRGLERWGAKDMVRASFRGFKALPEKASESKADYFTGCDTKQDVNQRFRSLSKTYHPDTGGDPEQFKELLRQYEMKMKDINMA